MHEGVRGKSMQHVAPGIRERTPSHSTDSIILAAKVRNCYNAPRLNVMVSVRAINASKHREQKQDTKGKKNVHKRIKHEKVNETRGK